MQEIARTKPVAPSGSKPLVPWAVAASTLVVVLFMLGLGNQRFFRRVFKNLIVLMQMQRCLLRSLTLQ